MTNEERDLIIQFVSRTGGRPATSGFAASVPTAGVPDLPPIDPQADGLMAELFVRYPEARYRITQLAFVQEHALAAATGQIRQLQMQLQQLQQQQQQQAPQQQAGSPWGNAPQAAPGPSRGLFGGLFGGGQPAPQQQYAAPPPQYAQAPMQYAPGYQPGMFQRPGGGFLGSALTTAAGVAGGIMAADALTGLFAGNHNAQSASFGGVGGGGGGGFGGAEASPWASAPAAAPAVDPYDQGGAAKDAPDSGWANAAPVDSGWQDASSGGDSGWTDAGGGGDYDNT